MEERFSCECKGCKSACKVKPGWMLPGEAEIIADHLGIPLKELFDRFLLVDYYLSGKEGHKYLLSPALKNKNTGTMTPSNPMGVCIFFDEITEHCQIHKVAPYECQRYDHTGTKQDIQDRHKWIAEQWNNEKDHLQLVELLGEEPFLPPIDKNTLIELMIHSMLYE